MIDPRREAVLITNQGTGQFGDRTRDVARYQTQTVGGKIDIVFNDSSRMFPYGSERVRILRNSERVSLPLGAKVEVGGFIWADATEVWAFTGPDGAWWRIFYSRAADLAQRGDNALSTRYWVSAVQAQAFAGLGDLDACQRALKQAEQVHQLEGQIHNGGWLRFDGSRLPEERGTCYVALQRPDLAEEALSDALSLNLSTRRHGSVVTDLAMLGAQRRDVDQLVTYANAALDTA
ncbi:MAG: hypothetical protein WAK86_05610, partial [Pseudonocardiaceae bacterium]